MKISYNWLKEFLPDLNKSPEELAELLTMHSFETEVSHTIEIDPSIKVVRIQSIEKHPNADRLQLATVSDGEEEIQVVCGAPNIKEGQVVPYAPPGSKVVDEDRNTFEIKTAKIRGVESPGMLASPRELGLSDDHAGIFVLPEDTLLGDKLADHIEKDTILEADITPNRAHDCLSHRGIAREIAALLELSMKEPEEGELPQAEDEVDGWSIQVEDEHKCRRYMGIVIDSIDIKPSPLWMQTRILSIGAKPINNAVDITNYVLFEIGNPTHVFDQSLLPGKKLGVRQASKNEKIVALDEEEYTLTPDDLVITSQDEPVSIAGVMGGLKTGMQPDTTKTVLEIANFSAYAVQETSRRLRLRSESSARFSKGIEVSRVEDAAKRAIFLLQELASAKISGRFDSHPDSYNTSSIPFDPEKVTKLSGMQVEADTAKEILERLRFDISASKKLWEVTPPADRLDIQAEHDVVEEVIRIVGLNEIPSVPLEKIERPASKLPAQPAMREQIKDIMTDTGLTETYNYSFEPEAYAALLDQDSREKIKLVNPVAPELQNMRASLLPGLLKNIVTNREQFHKNAGVKESALFEIGHVYKPGDGGQVEGIIEEEHVAGVIVGDFPNTDAISQAISSVTGVDQATLATLGSSGTLDQQVTTKLKYRLPIQFFEYNLTELVKHAGGSHTYTPQQTQERIQYQPFSQFPSILRDISVLVDPEVSVEQAQEVIERIGGDLVVDVDLFDEFEPKGENKKSLAFHVEYQAFDRTLTDEEVNPLHAQIIGALEEEISAQIR